MSGLRDTTSAFNFADDDAAFNQLDAAVEARKTRSALSSLPPATVLLSSAITPHAQSSSPVPAASLRSVVAEEEEARSPPPRVPLPPQPSPLPSAPTPEECCRSYQHQYDVGVATEEENGTSAATVTSSTAWCSPVQVLPNTIPLSTRRPSPATPSASQNDQQKGQSGAGFPTNPAAVHSDRGATTTTTTTMPKEREDYSIASLATPSQTDTTTSPIAHAAPASAVPLGALNSSERRSVTVTQHPLDQTSDYVDGLNVSGEFVCAAVPPCQARLFSPDFESPGRAAEEMKEWRARESPRAGLAAASVMEALSTQVLTSTSSSFFPPPAVQPCSGLAKSFLKGDVPSTLTSSLHADPNIRPAPAGDDGTGMRVEKVDSGVVSCHLEATALQPTPYPVTSASSLSDWSSAPRLGFPPPVGSHAANAEAESLPRRDAEERKREDKWYRLCRGVSLLASATPEAIVRLRSAAREHGIPHHLRAVMWLTLTGMALKVDENEYFCAKLLRRNGYVTGPNADAIAADVQRTFPGHPYFSERDVGVYKLTTVLHALCWRNPLLSYCQSFNFLAAFLLLVLDDEERVFWLLIHIFEQLLPNDFYGETLLGANVEQAVLERLVHQKLPRVAAKFAAAGLQVHTLVANWMMSLFVNVFPPSTSLRLWDYFFCRTTHPGERTPAHLEITLAVLKYLDERNQLAGEDAGELLIALREGAACLYDATAVIRIANSFAISQDKLHQLRREAKPTVVQNMKAREQARASEQERRLAQELQLARQANNHVPPKK
jgi:hypothetical protein